MNLKINGRFDADEKYDKNSPFTHSRFKHYLKCVTSMGRPFIDEYIELTNPVELDISSIIISFGLHEILKNKYECINIVIDYESANPYANVREENDQVYVTISTTYILLIDQLSSFIIGTMFHEMAPGTRETDEIFRHPDYGCDITYLLRSTTTNLYGNTVSNFYYIFRGIGRSNNLFRETSLLSNAAIAFILAHEFYHVIYGHTKNATFNRDCIEDEVCEELLCDFSAASAVVSRILCDVNLQKVLGEIGSDLAEDMTQFSTLACAIPLIHAHKLECGLRATRKAPPGYFIERLKSLLRACSSCALAVDEENLGGAVWSISLAVHNINCLCQHLGVAPAFGADSLNAQIRVGTRTPVRFDYILEIGKPYLRKQLSFTVSALQVPNENDYQEDGASFMAYLKHLILEMDNKIDSRVQLPYVPFKNSVGFKDCSKYYAHGMSAELITDIFEDGISNSPTYTLIAADDGSSVVRTRDGHELHVEAASGAQPIWI